MSVKITIPNTSSDYLTFGSANTPDAAKIGGYEDSTGNGHLELYTTASGTSTERMRIDASGNVGIGTSSPNISSATTKALTIASASGQDDAMIEMTQGSTIYGRLYSNGNGLGITGTGGIGIRFYTASTFASAAERMRIDSSGNVMVGTSTPAVTSRFTVYDASNRTSSTPQFNIEGAGYQELHWLDATACYIGQNSASRELRMFSGATPTTGVKLTNGATSWVSTSDENLKDIIEPIENAAEKVSTLRAVIGKYKDDEEGTRRPFLIAQDVEKVLPEAIHLGSDETLNLAYTETIPLLVAAIKEQQELIKQLQADVAALKGTV